MNGFNQFFQATAPGLTTTEYVRTIGSQDAWLTFDDRGVIAPGSFALLNVKGSLFIGCEMAAALHIQMDINEFTAIGIFYPFFVLNYPVKYPCCHNLYLNNPSNNPVEYKAFWAKEK